MTDPATRAAQTLQPAPRALAAPPPAAAAPTEAMLTALWRGQRFPAGALVTRTGVPVTVIFQGRPGRGPGPDFRGATIAGPSGVPLHGDVELHVRSSSFRAHGHHVDRAYARIVLHVVFEDDTGIDTPLPGGGSAPVVALAPWVATRADDLRRWLERPLLWREPCADSVMRLGAEAVAVELEREGDRRFEARVGSAAQQVAAHGLEQTLYAGLLEALGYGGNAAGMRALAAHAPWAALRDAIRPDDPVAPMEALLVGAAGLLPSQRGHRGPVEPHVAALEAAFARGSLTPMDNALWKLWGVRPANAPARRIAAAAATLASLGAPSALLSAVHASTVNEAIAPLTSAPPASYWLRHHDPCAGPSRLPPAFIGRSRALEILLNVVLPAAAASGDTVLAAQARALHAKLPRPAVYGLTRYLEENLASEGVRVPVNARRAQGLLGLHRDWCTQGGCGRCPLS